MPTSQKRAQRLLKGRRAVVHSSYPFTISLISRNNLLTRVGKRDKDWRGRLAKEWGHNKNLLI
jgi:hypothetical protein